MQIPALSTGVQSALGASNIRPDGTQRLADEVASGDAPESLQPTGRTSSSEATQPVEDNLNEVAASENEAAVTTKVVTDPNEVLGTTIGANINTTA